jgi:hypothetical protein
MHEYVLLMRFNPELFDKDDMSMPRINPKQLKK